MQTTVAGFIDAMQGNVVPLDWGLQISFDKSFDDDVTFFTYDVSEYNGPDVYAPIDDNPIQQWDKYSYTSYSDRVISMEWQRSIDFPYSVQSAMADVKLNNYDAYFTPRGTSPIEEYILPKRPIRLSAGVRPISVLPQLVGLTQGMPEIDNSSRSASFHILDFLSEMFGMSLTNTIAMQNVRTDEVLSELFQMFGLSPSQYNLAKGRNTIPFLFFEKGIKAGTVMRRLMQAEMGALWLDEQGIIRFTERLQQPQASVFTFDESNIISIDSTGDDEIINDIRITSDVREVQDSQPIFTNAQDDDANLIIDPAITPVVPAGGTAFYPYASLEDPAISAVVPTIGRKDNTSWFTAHDANGVEVVSGVSITLSQLLANSYTMMFDNTNPFPVYITQVEVWGEPAKIVDQIRYRAYDEDSVEKYGNQVLEIENDFFGSISNCDSFAEYVLDAYKEFAGVIEMKVKGLLSLQLGDIIDVDYEAFTDTYKVISITNRMADNNFEQTIRARHYTPRTWFQYDVSEYNGSDVYAP